MLTNQALKNLGVVVGNGAYEEACEEFGDRAAILEDHHTVGVNPQQVAVFTISKTFSL